MNTLKLELLALRAKMAFACWRIERKLKKAGHSLEEFDPEIHPTIEDNAVILYADKIWVNWGRSRFEKSPMYHLARVSSLTDSVKVVTVSDVLTKDQVVILDPSKMSIRDYQELTHDKHELRKSKLLEI